MSNNMKKEELYKSYVLSLGEAIRDYALEAKKEKDLSVGRLEEDFATGYLSGFHRIVTLMKQHAQSYDIPLNELSLEDLKEKDLV